MTTKGAGAEGARPLCGAAEGRPHIFGIFSVFSALDFFSVFPDTSPYFFTVFSVFFLYPCRVSGSGFVFVFVSAGVGLTCGIPRAKFWEETTWLNKAFFWTRPPFRFGP